MRFARCSRRRSVQTLQQYRAAQSLKYLRGEAPRIRKEYWLAKLSQQERRQPGRPWS